MRYEEPVELSEQEIRRRLSDKSLLPNERIQLVLSAIYSCSTECAGDILHGEFGLARYSEKSDLKNLFETFHAVHRTAYRVKDGIALLVAYKQEVPQFQNETDYIIEGLREFAEIFPNRE